MSVYAYTALHYGADYLGWAVESVMPVAKEHIVLYASKPSYGQRTDMVCPETFDQLRDEVPESRWIHGNWSNETAHRQAIFKYLPNDTELLVVVDADEVYTPELEQAVEYLMVLPQNKRRRKWRVGGFKHLWRSFNHACTDTMNPIRFIDLRAENPGEGSIYSPVLHFGYAQTYELMKYKWAIHGHKNELRTDYDWMQMYQTWWMGGCRDCHPTCVGIWDPQPIDVLQYAPQLADHKFYGLEAI